jgi:hypothetical protein
MLETKLNHLVEDGQLEIFTIIKVKKFVITFPTVVASKADGKKGFEIILLDIVPLVPGSEKWSLCLFSRLKSKLYFYQCLFRWEKCSETLRLLMMMER